MQHGHIYPLGTGGNTNATPSAIEVSLSPSPGAVRVQCFGKGLPLEELLILGVSWEHLDKVCCFLGHFCTDSAKWLGEEEKKRTQTKPNPSLRGMRREGEVGGGRKKKPLQTSQLLWLTPKSPKSFLRLKCAKGKQTREVKSYFPPTLPLSWWSSGALPAAPRARASPCPARGTVPAPSAAGHAGLLPAHMQHFRAASSGDSYLPSHTLPLLQGCSSGSCVMTLGFWWPLL